MDRTEENPLPLDPSAAGYRALIDRFNAAQHAHNSGQIDFYSFREAVLEIDEQSRFLNLLRKLHRAHRAVAAEEQTHQKRAVSS